MHPDHLNSPGRIYDQNQQLVWVWEQGEPFGNDVPNSNPSGAGAFDFPLRFPGQYFDRETSLSHNYFRDYNATIGRYVQSDPAGLRGGLNTYGYVRGNPLTRADEPGLGVVSGSLCLVIGFGATAYSFYRALDILQQSMTLNQGLLEQVDKRLAACSVDDPQFEQLSRIRADLELNQVRIASAMISLQWSGAVDVAEGTIVFGAGQYLFRFPIF